MNPVTSPKIINPAAIAELDGILGTVDENNSPVAHYLEEAKAGYSVEAKMGYLTQGQPAFEAPVSALGGSAWDEAAELDFSSFPTITLEKGQFSTKDLRNIGDFTCVMVEPRKQFLYKNDKGRDTEPDIVYSDDDVTEKGTGRPLADITNEWEAKGYPWDKSIYTIVVAMIQDTELAGTIAQLQISPSSRVS